jgi:hypothetical protein
MKEHIYKIMVDVPGRKKIVTYPLKGFQLYTRKEAISNLREFAKKGFNMNNVWAESETERFTLDMIEKGKENGN